MTLEDVDKLADELGAALDELVDDSGRWKDLPLAYFDPDDGWGDRWEMECSACGCRFWPIYWTDNWEWKSMPFYYQAGY